jgi:hypothetical protein
MRIKIISVVALCFAGSLVCHGQMSTANVSDHKAEAGFFYTGINLEGFGETINGLGGRVAYNLNNNFAIDAEFSFSPETKLGNDQSGQKTQLLAGLKAGVRSRRVGVFAKARPGVMFIGEVTSGFNCSGTTFGQTCRPSHNNFALDVGGVLEVYPSARTIVRFDAGDTIVRIRNATSGFIGPPVVTNSTTHNFQFSVGVGYRF